MTVVTSPDASSQDNPDNGSILGIDLKQLMSYKPCVEGLTEFKKLKKRKDSKLTDLQPSYYLWGCRYFPEHINKEYFDYCVSEKPYEALEYCVDLLSQEQFIYCVRKDPAYAIEEFSDKLDAETFDYCVTKKPFQALALVVEKLTKSQFDYCVKKAPYAALLHTKYYLSVAQFLYCIKQHPRMVKFKYIRGMNNVTKIFLQ